MSKKNLGSHLIKVAVTGAVIWWIAQTYGWHNIVETISKAKIGWLIGGFLLNVASLYLGALQWQILLQNKEIVLPFGKTVKLYFMGMFFNNFIFGTVAGDAFKIASLHLDKKEGKPGFAATFLDRLAGLLTLSGFAIISSVIILVTNIQQNKELLYVMGILALFISIIIAFFILIISQRLQNALREFLKKIPKFPARDLVTNLLELSYINRRQKDQMDMVLSIAVLSIIIQVMRIAVHMFCAQAFGIFSFATMHYFFVIIPIIALLMIVPMPFGIREAIGGILFTLAGFEKEESVVMEFLATILGIAASLIGGVMFVMDKKSIETRGK